MNPNYRVIDPFGNICCSDNMMVNPRHPLEGHCSVCGRIWELAPDGKWYTSWAFVILGKAEIDRKNLSCRCQSKIRQF